MTMTASLANEYDLLDRNVARNMHYPEKATALVEDYNGTVYRAKDTESRQVHYMMSFPNMFRAIAFAETARKWFASVDLLVGGPQVLNLDDEVMLVAVTK